MHFHKSFLEGTSSTGFPTFFPFSFRPIPSPIHPLFYSSTLLLLPIFYLPLPCLDLFLELTPLKNQDLRAFSSPVEYHIVINNNSNWHVHTISHRFLFKMTCNLDKVTLDIEMKCKKGSTRNEHPSFY